MSFQNLAGRGGSEGGKISELHRGRVLSGTSIIDFWFIFPYRICFFTHFFLCSFRSLKRRVCYAILSLSWISFENITYMGLYGLCWCSLYIYIYIFTWFIAQGLMLGKRLNIFAICFLPFVSFWTFYTISISVPSSFIYVILSWWVHC